MQKSTHIYIYIYIYIYILLLFVFTWYLFIYQVYFLFGDICTFVHVHGSLLYMDIICVTTTVVCMYICFVIKYSKGKDQPGKVAILLVVS